MRTLKFRAWDRLNKEWLYIRLDRGNFTASLLSSFRAPNDYTDWQQFTGLTDRNGTEIYEGDIVRVGEWVEPEPGESPADGWLDASVREVRWGGDYPAFDVYPILDEVESNNLQWYADIQPNGERIEVIGNIYEHPQLLMQAGE